MNDKQHAGTHEWLGYSSLAAAFLAVAPSARGQVVYTDIDPDSTVVDGDMAMDLDGDGTVDLTLHQEHFSFSSVNVQLLSVMLPVGNQLIGQGNSGYSYPGVLENGEPVAPDNDDFASFANGVLGIVYPGAPYGLWPGQTGFLGCKFIAGDGQPHFAWVQLSVANNAGECVVKDFGYESQPNIAINAGDMGAAGIAANAAPALGFSLWPNPSQDRVFIHLVNAVAGEVRTSLLDNLGEVVLEREAQASGILMLDLTDVAPGNYFLRVVKDGSTTWRKLVKR